MRLIISFNFLLSISSLVEGDSQLAWLLVVDGSRIRKWLKYSRLKEWRVGSPSLYSSGDPEVTMLRP